ncbi:DNA polymerase-3 subunit gamma/tau [Anaerosphaera aminiphila DSM 21120]|uniref:DNA-directed DNA polymerase n=1 Tax=Anaerosphaera aminiphila DSM 21120 TaxID=1120995 RepID=A0A1M5PDR5_9FIRM|nr:DNA polymerase III subunit gamma/tau [Anaerosphaera aminiphila]SHG99857.1 DNA polymerase-3 subunit gamma/tau [Anaerosphaera aminiphila DSM 21120]
MYQALYRKYRSKTFGELLGQDSIVMALKNQIKNEELSHAYLFSGTRGTGKTSAAKIFARAVNCLNPKDGEPCNECESCRAILEDRVMDVVEMDAASNNGVDDIRELKEKVIYPPSTSKYKVYIIDEVHMLSKGAFNALLKILEEPPKHLIFILATTEPEKIPQTILSRTQRFNFKRIGTNTIIENLKRITELENKSCDDEVYALIANNSDGAMRDALSLLDQCLSFTDEHISYELAIEILGVTNDDIIFELIDALIESDIDRALLSLDNIYMAGKDITILISDLIMYFRNLMVVKTVKNPKELFYTTKLDEYIRLAKKISIDKIIEILKILSETLNNVKYVQDKRTIFEMSIIRINSLENESSLAARVELLEEKLKNLQSSGKSFENTDISEERIQSHSSVERTLQKLDEEVEISTIKTQTQQSKSISKEINSENLNLKTDVKSGETKTTTVSKITLDIILENWNKILNEIKQQRRVNVAVLLGMAKIADFKDNTLFIEYDEKNFFNYKAISNEDNIKFLTEFLSKFFSESIEVKFVLSNLKDKGSVIEKVEDVFGKENIQKI